MSSQEDVLSFLDLLDLDEDVIDTRLKSIIVRSNYTNQHLTNALHLLRYKHLINTQENTECKNVDEFDFAVKLIKDINEDTVDIVCRIINTVLKLNTTTLVSYSEHLLLQILSNIGISKSSDAEEKSKAVLHLKVCDSVLEATIKQGEKLSMAFLETPLEEILSSRDEQLKIHFVTNSVQKLVEGIDGYDILTRIWCYLIQLRGDKRSTTLKVLSSLSDYYLPVAVGDGKIKYESTLVCVHNFWEVVLFGLMSDDATLRKISVYLAKRAIDYIITLKVNINVKSGDDTIFSWEHNNCDLYKNQWDNFFILMDSLEEKQSNIVLPSLQLFDAITNIDFCWLNCAYNIGLKHDNGQVRLKCVEHRIKTNLNSDSDATVLLEALNNIFFYDNTHDCKALKEKLSKLLKCDKSLQHFLKAMPGAHSSPVPLYHLSDILANLDVEISWSKDFNVSQIIIDILKVYCNIIAIREATHFNIADFVGKSCKNLHWKEIACIYVMLQSETWAMKKKHNSIFAVIREWELQEADVKEFYKYVTDSHSNIDVGMAYLDNHLSDVNIFVEIINEKIKTIEGIINRQYSIKTECLNDVQYLLTLQWKCSEDVRPFLQKASNTILQYAYCLLLSDVILSIEETKSIFNNLNFNLEDDLKDIAIQLYKTSVTFLLDPQTDLENVVQSLCIINCFSNNNYFINNYKHEILDLERLLQSEAVVHKKEVPKTQTLSRWRNLYYETHCKIVYSYIETQEQRVSETRSADNVDVEKEDVKPNLLKEIVDYVEKVTECGGYGCLEWILKIMNNTLKYLTDSQFNITQFISRMWSEIEELKSSSQYLPCMKEFVKLITHRTLTEKPDYNNVVILYCSKIIELGSVNNSPLYYLVDNEQLCLFIEEQNRENSHKYGHLVYILSEIMLFCPVPRKDQRVADNLTLAILKNFGEECNNTELRFNFTVLYKAVHILSKVPDSSVALALATFIMKKIDILFKAKLRYHGNSQVHRTLQTALQHLLFILYLKSDVDDADMVSNWCMELLGRLPHQPSVRICLEWHIALHFYLKKANLDKILLKALQYKNIPLTSQFTIIYWMIKRKIANNTFSQEEYQFVMNTFLSHTMGQMFNVRLLAQYLAIQLYKRHENNSNYQYIIQVIHKTLDDNAKDKNLVKLKDDYIMNDFDLIGNLTPFFIYYTLPRLCDVNINETVDTKFVLDIMEDTNKFTEKHLNGRLKEEWMKDRRRDKELINIEQDRQVDKISEDVKALGTIQKKYIPWKSMSDINVYNVDVKRECPSDLIVVASLIDKLPNLGGMARTSEVFGVRTYVIDSLRHVQDKQFQGLSVSAERWVDVQEVRPGQPLKDYLNRKKAEGYSVVAAEQTSTSSKLQAFKFPRKTLLLLGHEKDGIPCDLLPMMDHCVEIPQQGFVRSLNVHVTAAIFVWEYARQNLL